MAGQTYKKTLVCTCQVLAYGESKEELWYKLPKGRSVPLKERQRQMDIEEQDRQTAHQAALIQKSKEELLHKLPKGRSVPLKKRQRQMDIEEDRQTAHQSALIQKLEVCVIKIEGMFEDYRNKTNNAITNYFTGYYTFWRISTTAIRTAFRSTGLIFRKQWGRCWTGYTGSFAEQTQRDISLN